MAKLLSPKKYKDSICKIIDAQGWGKNRNPFDPSYDYEFDESMTPWEPGDDVRGIHSVPDLIRCLKHGGKGVEIESKFFGVKEGHAKLFRVNGKKNFLEAIASNKKRTFRESIDSFSFESGDNTGLGGMLGQDFVPLLGGPFTKQLYYTDYLKMHNACFFAMHHSPVGRRYVSMMKHFTLGRGFSVECDDDKALAVWNAFVEVNNFYENFGPLSIEYSTYGEIMLHWLPNNQTAFRWDVPQDQIPVGLIPRIRIIDPSTIWEIITYPEDTSPSGVLAYQQIFPTQWQMYTVDNVPSTKFIYQQIPARDMMHFKTNVVSNEKRGRSDMFPFLTYDKRLRDAVNYGLVAEMKNAAWCIDTEVDGNQKDIDTYKASMEALGTIPAAGSDFIHSKKIKRQYMAGATSGSRDSMIFNWCMSMVAMGSGIPLPYWGIELGSKGTRGNAVVGTEPVTKVFEDRQQDYAKFVRVVSQKLFRIFNIKAELKVNFPEIISQDRSAKLADIQLAQMNKWIKPEVAAALAAKELGLDDFDYDRDAPNPGEDDGEDAPAPLSAQGSGLDKNAVKDSDRRGGE